MVDKKDKPDKTKSDAPPVGKMVTVFGIDSNGANEQPAIVTRVWGNDEIGPDIWNCNLTVFPDNAAAQSRTSVHVFPNHDDAINWRNEEGNQQIVAYWAE